MVSASMSIVSQETEKVSEGAAEQCPCGSHRDYVLCCGRTGTAEAEQPTDTDAIRSLYAEARQAAVDRRFLHALRAAEAILQQVRGHRGAIRMALTIPNPMRVFDRERLKAIATTGLASFPDDLELQCDASEAFMTLSEIKEAEQLLRAVLEKAPDHFRAHAGLGAIAKLRNQLDLAEYHFRLAHYQRRFSPRILRELGTVLSAMGRKHESEHYFRVALAQAPLDYQTLLSWCRMEESRGNLAKAWQLLDFTRGKSANPQAVTVMEAVLHRRAGNFKQSILSLDRIDAKQIPAPASRARYAFERCATLDKLGLFDQAFASAERANATKVKEMGLVYDGERHADNAERLRKAFTTRRLKALHKGDPQSDSEPQPVFICGFTRSGTSMVEQILSGHTRISGGDELPFIHDLAAKAKEILKSEQAYPECLFENPRDGEPAPLQLLRRRYLNRLRLTSILEPGVAYFTDKMPMNEFHLGLIHGLFPEARIIHVVRHPFDSVLSTYFTDATHGGNCGYQLESAARHYRLLLDMVEHFRKKPGIKLLRIKYEDIVKNIDKEIGRMLDFIGLQMEQACIDFHLNPRYSRTASYAQVTEELYDTSVFRYRNYRKHLRPILDILQPAVSRLGYKP